MLIFGFLFVWFYKIYREKAKKIAFLFASTGKE